VLAALGYAVFQATDRSLRRSGSLAHH
jgi:hypothetical protein